MRIAVVDLLFAWPPNGGADVDLYHVLPGLREMGHEVLLLTARERGVWERGKVDPERMPFPVEVIPFLSQEMTEERLAKAVRAAVDRFKPDRVLLAQGYFFKTALALALRDYPVISRCYAHETACHKDILRFRGGMPCPNAYALTPDLCRRCALSHLAVPIRRGYRNPWVREYLAMRAWSPSYYERFLAAMASLRAVIVTNEGMRSQVDRLTRIVHVVPNGIDTLRFCPPDTAVPRARPVLLMTGRVEDPAKGFGALLAAASWLQEQGLDFELHATLPPGVRCPAWVWPLGWHPYEAMPLLYQAADVCVIPSLWEEPFGMVALEAMATGLPVCASRAGGLQDIVRHEDTGFLCPPGDTRTWADALARLLTDPALRTRMGVAGRARAATFYAWPDIIGKYYGKIFS